MGKKDERQEVRFDYRVTDTGETGSASVSGTKDEVQRKLLEVSRGGDVEVTPPR